MTPAPNIQPPWRVSQEALEALVEHLGWSVHPGTATTLAAALSDAGWPTRVVGGAAEPSTPRWAAELVAALYERSLDWWEAQVYATGRATSLLATWWRALHLDDIRNTPKQHWRTGGHAAALDVEAF